VTVPGTVVVPTVPAGVTGVASVAASVTTSARARYVNAVGVAVELVDHYVVTVYGYDIVLYSSVEISLVGVSAITTLSGDGAGSACDGEESKKRKKCYRKLFHTVHMFKSG